MLYLMTEEKNKNGIFKYEIDFLFEKSFSDCLLCFKFDTSQHKFTLDKANENSREILFINDTGDLLHFLRHALIMEPGKKNLEQDLYDIWKK
jgi:hypothetical protein